VNRLLVSGGTGFIGRHLVRALVARGAEVTVLSRSASSESEGVRTALWVPGERGAWFEEVERAGAVVHLAGEQAAGVRLTPAKKREIEQSRLATTERIVEAIAEAKTPPAVLVCASAVGFYGPRDAEELLDETSEPGTGFLAELTVKWEAAAHKASASGVRVVSARLGIVLGKDGGALPQMARPFRMFAGGPLGDGRQIVPWIHVEDAVRALLFAIEDPRVEGPINVVAPNPVSNRELSRAIGRVLGRPSWLPVPRLALELAFGREGAQPIVTGQRAVPRVLEGLGFEFRYPRLEPALEEALR
jgi:uncharacterized protein (TIGR01777 family)